MTWKLDPSFKLETSPPLDPSGSSRLWLPVYWAGSDLPFRNTGSFETAKYLEPLRLTPLQTVLAIQTSTSWKQAAPSQHAGHD